MTSYKRLWQEAETEIQALKDEIARLRKEIDASPDEHLRELERIRGAIDLAGIARHMRVDRLTPQQWKQRGLLPPVDFPEIKGEPLWHPSSIRAFAERTGRIWYDHPGAPEEGMPPAA